MRTLKDLFDRNRAWAGRLKAQDPAFFSRLAQQQSPQYLWIGCADSRVPANQIVDLLPGELFVHRNVSNVVAFDDLNGLSVIQFAVDALRVRHVIVCGHYGCAGVRAALRDERLGLVDQWLVHVRDVRDRHRALLDALPDEARQWDRLCELNVIEQAVRVCRAEAVTRAWEKGQTLSVHGWIYRLEDGLLRDLGICVTKPEEITPEYEAALAALK